MRVLLILFFLFLLSPQTGSAQYPVKEAQEIEIFKAIPGETVFIHFNDNVLLAGEYLYYKLYCLNLADKSPSTISKIGYVELVGQANQTVFRHKIRLESGSGQGDFLIPTTVATGSYKLVGYTQWMRNSNSEPYTLADLSILNPYLELPEENQDPGDTFNVQKGTAADLLNPRVPAKSNDLLKLHLSQKKFGKREAVNVEIENLMGVIGTFSVSVRKKSPFRFKPKQTSVGFLAGLETQVERRSIEPGDTIFLPELRGELISGRVVSGKGDPVIEEEISLSIPNGDQSVVKVTNTNSEGYFYTVLDEHRETADIYLQKLGTETNEVKLINTTDQPPEFNTLKFEKLLISPKMSETIRKHSIYNQIENAFIEKRRDSTLPVRSKPQVYKNLPEVFLLDDYTRFPSLKETIVEIINDVFIKKINDKYVFQVRADDEFFLNPTDLPLVLVDGILVQNFETLINYNARNIEKISLAKEQYYIGPKLYHGIISITTKAGNFFSLLDDKNIVQWEVPAPIVRKKYYSHKYSDQSIDYNKNLPDFRTQLFWEPNLIVNQKDRDIFFYTSDNTGTYEISLEGFTKDGKAVFIKEDFTVE